jgi:MoxR-like ATPase
MGSNVEQTAEEAQRLAPAIIQLREEIGKIIVGQQNMVERLLVGIFSDGHILVEGVPGLAKTTAVKTFSDALSLSFRRIQFTPDLLPADLIGTEIFSQKDGLFSVKQGPIFANIILADEINRAPAKVQSALLEAMQERQVTIGDKTFLLPSPFLVMATQNPIEQEGTYPLPEAQVDRFMLKITVTYPTREEEIAIMKKSSVRQTESVEKVLTAEKINQIKAIIDQIFIDDKLYDYVASIVFSTRNPDAFGLKALAPLIEYGASPRASICLIKAARTYAFLQGRGYVTPQDIKAIGPDVLRHRLVVSYEAEAQEQTSDDLLKKIFDTIDVP